MASRVFTIASGVQGKIDLTRFECLPPGAGVDVPAVADAEEGAGAAEPPWDNA
jgi:hypothetical protein